MSAPEFTPHNHQNCIKTTVAAVQSHCASNGLKLTPMRIRVLEILLNKHRAIGAYKILEQLQNEGAAPQPPIVYRALDFLVSHGFAHKVEALNAFVACTHPGQSHDPTFLICRKCETVAETQDTPTLPVATKGFLIEQATVELQGLCQTCQDAL